MRMRSKIDGKIYDVNTFETYSDDCLGLEYTTVDGSNSELSAIGKNGGRTGYSSLAQINEYWEDTNDE